MATEDDIGPAPAETFADLDAAAAKLADAADRLSQAAAGLGVAGDPIRHNPDLDAAFGEVAQPAKDVAGGPGGSGDPIRHNPDLDAAFGVTEGDGQPARRPAAPSPTEIRQTPPPLPTESREQTAKNLASSAGWSKLSEQAAQVGGLIPSPGGDGPGGRPGGGVSPSGLPAPAGGAGAAAGGNRAGEVAKTVAQVAQVAQFIPGPIGAAAKVVGPIAGAVAGAAGGGGGGSGGGGPGGGTSPSGPPSGGSGGAGSSLTGPGASGVAETAQKVAGMVPVVGDVVNGLMKFARAVVEGADAQHRLNMQYADASAAMAGVLAEAEMRDWQRDREIGDKTAETARDLAESRANYQDNVGKVEALFSNIKNEVFSKLLDVLNTVVEPFADLLEGINDILFTQSESTAANDWLDQAEKRAEARRKAGDEWFQVRRAGG